MKSLNSSNRGGKRKTGLATKISSILEGCEKRVSDPQKYATPYDNERGFYLRKLYRVISSLRRKRAIAELREYASARGVSPPPQLVDNDYAWLLAVTSAAQGKSGKAISNQIRLTAHMLQYAQDRKVPARYLVGFIYQVGGSKRIERLRLEHAGKGRPDGGLPSTSPTKGGAKGRQRKGAARGTSRNARVRPR